MPQGLPLPALLSHALVAFTIEFDNEAEHRMPHRTSNYGVTPGALHAPWLVSLAMWENCLRHLPESGLTVAELLRRARTPANLGGMERWRYVTVAPESAGGGRKPPKSAWVVKPTAGGRMAQQIWRPLAADIEARWQERFGAGLVGRLRESLGAIEEQLNPGLPDCLPILRYGLFSAGPDPKLPPLGSCLESVSARPLYSFLSRVLLAFAIDFERNFAPSLAICANLVRVLGDKGVRVRDLPVVSGVSKEALSMAMGIVTKARLVALVKNPDGSAFKVARLTAMGLFVQQAYPQRIADIEDRWNTNFGAARMRRLREVLEELAGDGTPGRSPLFKGLEPYPDGWRASVRRPSTLPHFPMVLHRGGFPDGS